MPNIFSLHDASTDWMRTPLPAPLPPGAANVPPTDADCERYWDDYGMFEHIKAHSRMVAEVATFLAVRAHKAGVDLCVQTVRASALLHDIAKTYCIKHGGSHNQLGGAWALALTGDPLLAQGVVHHVYWPFALDARTYFLPLAVLYADKRVAHDQFVNMDERFHDLLDRYGHSERTRDHIRGTYTQAKDVEAAFSELIEVDLHAYSFDRGRLV